MSRTTPVRWWRDDATRYQSRPPYVSPPYAGPRLDLLPLAPSVLEAMARLKKRGDDAIQHYLGPQEPEVDVAVAKLQDRVNHLVRRIENNLEQPCGLALYGSRSQ